MFDVFRAKCMDSNTSKWLKCFKSDYMAAVHLTAFVIFPVNFSRFLLCRVRREKESAPTCSFSGTLLKCLLVLTSIFSFFTGKLFMTPFILFTDLLLSLKISSHFKISPPLRHSPSCNLSPPENSTASCNEPETCLRIVHLPEL